MRKKPREHYIVDGYNVINLWPELTALRNDLSEARDKLVHMLAEYGAYEKYDMTVVFDALFTADDERVEQVNKHLEVVYTGKGETADSYIEKHVSEWKKKYRLIVASSDGLIQNTILAHGCQRMSARELEKRALSTNADAFKTFHTL